jgi:nitrite reductase (NADH) large subunit
MNYLIIGNSACGRSAVQEILRCHPVAKVTVISEESSFAYYRPLISHLLARDIAEEKVFMEPFNPEGEQEVNTRLGERATAIEAQAKIVSLDNGEKLSYDRLLLSTGGRPIVPQIERLETEGVYQFNSLGDVEKIIGFSDKTERAVVVGGGLSGIRSACALRQIGKEVTVVELLDRPLWTVLDSKGAEIVRRHLESQGVRIITERRVQRILSTNGRVSGVILSDGQGLDCQTVILSIGVRPNLDLVDNIAVKVNRGILVGRHLQTSMSGVYAAGDVCETYDPTLGEFIVNANWTCAVQQGKLAGRNMCGSEEVYRGSIAINSLDLFGLACITVGVTNPNGGRFQIVSKANPGRNVYRKLVFKGDFIVGAIFIGEIRGAGAISRLLQDRVPLGGVKDSILEEKRPYVHFLRSLYRDDLEDEIPWRQELSSTEKYKKKFDDERWRQREGIKE